MFLRSNRAWSGRMNLAVVWSLLIGVSILAGCGLASQPTEVKEYIFFTATATTKPTDTLLPSPTPTLAPTETPQPTSTTPPTATPVPPLGVAEDGFKAWCYPLSYAGYTPQGPEGPADTSQLINKDGNLSIKIPAAFCTLSFRFNQAMPEGAVLTLFDGSNAFLRLPLKAVDGHADQGWTSVSHTYVVNPPFWEVSYRLSLSGADGKELWTNAVKFGKPLPDECPFGGLPDPITLYCTHTDPWEVEPWPDVTRPYDPTRLTPSGD